MKKLYLIRHAKSSWSNANLNDFDRPLNKRGHSNAPEMAQRLVDNDISFDLIVSSPANRAKTTAQYFLATLNLSPKQLTFNESIYEAGFGNLVSIIQSISNKVNSLALFGHNPTFTGFANKLCGTNIANVPTCGIVAIGIETTDWAKFYEAEAKLLFFDFPKNVV